jgi:tRNA threonylcarbamoyladenosine biosynthesis protein TsaE
MDSRIIPEPAGFARCRLTHGPAGTRALGRDLAGVVRPGDAVLVYGELGAGKTCLIQGLCATLGVSEAVLSPSFTLINRYQGRWTIDHLDFYRVAPEHDLHDIGVLELLDELADRRTVLLAEWPHRLAPLLARRVELLATGGGQPDQRRWYARGMPELPAAWAVLFPEANPAC